MTAIQTGKEEFGKAKHQFEVQLMYNRKMGKIFQQSVQPKKYDKLQAERYF